MDVEIADRGNAGDSEHRRFAFRCVDEVVIGAPYTVTKALMDHFRVSKTVEALVV